MSVKKKRGSKKVTIRVGSLCQKSDSGNAIQLVFAILLLVLGGMVAVEGLQKLFGKKEEK